MHRYSIKHIIVFLIFLIFHPFFSKWFGFNGFSPDFLLVVLMIFAFNKEKSHTLIAALVFGLLCDLLYSHILLQYSAIFLFATLSVWGVNKLTKLENILYLSIFGFISGYVFSLIKILYELPIGEIIANFPTINKVSLISGVYYLVAFMLISIFYFIKSMVSVNKVPSNMGRMR